MPRRLSVIALLVACPLVGGLSACDSGSSIDPDEDEALIEDSLLTLDDLPDGFEEVDVDNDDTDQGPADECNEDILDIDPDALDEAKTAEPGPVRFDSETLSVRAEITAFDSDDDIVRIVEAVDDDEFIDCLLEAAQDGQEPGVTILQVDAIDSPLEDDDDVTAGAIGIVLEVDSEATSGIVIAAEQQQHLVVVDRFGIILNVVAEEGQIESEVVEDALEAMVERLRDGLEQG